MHWDHNMNVYLIHHFLNWLIVRAANRCPVWYCHPFAGSLISQFSASVVRCAPFPAALAIARNHRHWSYLWVCLWCSRRLPVLPVWPLQNWINTIITLNTLKWHFWFSICSSDAEWSEMTKVSCILAKWLREIPWASAYGFVLRANSNYENAFCIYSRRFWLSTFSFRTHRNAIFNPLRARTTSKNRPKIRSGSGSEWIVDSVSKCSWELRSNFYI